jgi:group I intron endonuclease
MVGYTYAHINRANEKAYVGQTWDLKTRWSPSAYKGCKLFNRAIEKYGWDGFDHIIIFQGEITQEELNARESLWIAILKSNDPRFGYNMTTGGEGVRGLVITEETREKLRQSGRERGVHPNCRKAQREYMKNRVVSPETRAKIAAAHLGKKKAYAPWNKGIKRDPEFCRHMSEIQKGKKRGPRSEETKQKIREKFLGHPSWAVPHTEETKARMSEIAKARPPRPQSPEIREKIRQSLKGRKRPPELMARIVATRKKNKQNGTDSHRRQSAESSGSE